MAFAAAARTWLWPSARQVAKASVATGALSMPSAAAAALLTSELGSSKASMSTSSTAVVLTPRYPSEVSAATRTRSTVSKEAWSKAGRASAAARPNWPSAVATAARTSSSRSRRLTIRDGTAVPACSPSLSRERAAARRIMLSVSVRQVVSAGTALTTTCIPSRWRRYRDPSGRASTVLVWPAMFISAFVALSRTRLRGSFSASQSTGTTFSACASISSDSRYLTVESGCSSARIAA
mmetsp:Transcript_6327/g.14857  ORF Transcript_6327/g.14857 Transcript_6327/m.14857 type:complete len:237 (+) Transcript_6327:763-1473(+)